MSNIRLAVASLVGILAVGASLSATSIERTKVWASYLVKR